jgi:hypothetical protein
MTLSVVPVEANGADPLDTEAYDIGEAPQAPDPLNPDAYTLSQDFSETGSSQKLITTVPVRRPGKQTFFRVHPGEAFRRNIALLEYGDDIDKETYLVDPALHTDLADNIRRVTIFTAITRQGSIVLVPVRLPNSHRKDLAATSLREAMEIAMERWVKVIWNAELKAFETHVAAGKLPDPVWPANLAFADLFDRAFSDKVINDMEHPVVRQLFGYE